jgi:single-stranded-DNA-specific exonuclease
LSKRWIVPGPVPAAVADELRSFGPAEQAVLWRRGVNSMADAEAYFRTSPIFRDPFSLLGMRVAVDRLRVALQTREKVVVYGDYDADGLTATALMVLYLQQLGADVVHFIPNRYREGYGLTEEALTGLAADGARLVLSVDCGARSVPEALAARRLGLDLIITDHHAPGPVLPEAVAVVNPKQPGDGYPFDDLSGAGLAYKVTQALATALGGPNPENLLDLVAIGTIADLVPLRGENRDLARAGLACLRSTDRPGLKALMSAAGISPVSLKASSVGFGIGPRLNAAGRLDSAEAAYRLLTTESVPEAAELAQKLESINRDRRQATSELVNLARGMAEQGDQRSLIFAAHPDFLEGIAGLVAARLAEEHYRPAIVAHRGEAQTRGSARSIPGFHITRALDECADLLIRYGGHAAAAGFTLATQDVEAFEKRLQVIAERELLGADLTPAIEIDAVVGPEQLGWRLVEFGESLEPCGYGNEAPTFAARGLRVRSARTAGADGKHLKLLLGAERGVGAWDAIGFGMGALAAGLSGNVDVAFHLERNTYAGYDSLQFNLADVRAAG